MSKSKPPEASKSGKSNAKPAAKKPVDVSTAPNKASGKDSHSPADKVPVRANGEVSQGSPSISSYILGSTKKHDDNADAKLTPFLRKQKKRLLVLRDAMLDSMNGVAQDTLRARAENNEASAFGMHQADAGSDSYDRDFALSLLSQEQDALYEIDEALKRIELGTYGVCEMSGKAINHERLEAIPFTRFTVECQSQIERQNKAQRVRQSVTSLFGLTDDDEPDKEEEEFTPDTKE
jgi:DnaK suppressor protein